MRLRTRLLLLGLLPLAGLYAVAMWWTETTLESAVTDRYRDELAREARLVARATAGVPFSDSLADALGAAVGHRVTLIAPDGSVMGDSEVPAARIPEVESHRSRPEVRGALEGDTAAGAARASATVARHFSYVAVPDPRGVVRVAMPTEEIVGVLDRPRGILTLLTLGAAVFLVFFSRHAERFLARSLAPLRRSLEAVGGREEVPRAKEEGAGELGRLAREVNAVAGRMEAARAARRERDELASVFSRLEEGLAVVDGESRVVRVNPTFSRWIGREEVTGEDIATLVRNPGVRRAVADALAGESVRREIVRGEHTFQITARPHREGAILVVRDLTELRRLEGVRRDFVANVSHELKTPLTTVTGFAEALVDEDVPGDRVREFAARILHNARRMRRLVDDLLDLSRIETGAWEPHAARTDVAEVARGVWEGLPLPSSGRRPPLDVEGAVHPVEADPEGLRQILRNLLDNALRYAPADRPVRVSTRRTDDRVRVEVSDEGPGIPSAHRERIFERFYRVDPARSREAGGTGLGLAIVKHVVRAHDGAVGVESELDRGTTVWFTLPAVPDAPAPGAGASAPAPGA